MSKAQALSKAINSLLPVIEDDVASPILAQCLNALTQISLDPQKGVQMRSPVVQTKQPAPIPVPGARSYTATSPKIPAPQELLDALNQLKNEARISKFVRDHQISINSAKRILDTKMVTPEMNAKIMEAFAQENQSPFQSDAVFNDIIREQNISFTRELQS